MTKKLKNLLLLSLLVPILAMAGTPPGVQIPIPQESKHYLLTEENSITFRGPVYSASVTDFGERLLNLSYSLRDGDTINIILDSQEVLFMLD